MLHADDDVAFKHFDAAGESVRFRVFVPLVEDVEFLVGRGIEIFHAGIDGNHAGTTGAIKAAGLHLHAGFLTCVQEKGTGFDFGGLTAGHDCNFWHNKKSGRSRKRNIIASATKTMRLINLAVCWYVTCKPV